MESKTKKDKIQLATETLGSIQVRLQLTEQSSFLTQRIIFALVLKKKKKMLLLFSKPLKLNSKIVTKRKEKEKKGNRK